MNNKGQTLVIFIILLPIIMVVFAYVIDKGYLLYQEKSQKKITSLVCQYALNEEQEDHIRQLALENDNNLKEIMINRSNEQVEITLEKDMDSIFGKLLGISTYHIKTTIQCIR